MKRLLIVLLVSTPAALAPATAHAATASVDTMIEGSDITRDPGVFGYLRYSAAAGEANDLTVTKDSGAPPDLAIRSTAPGRPGRPERTYT